MCFLPVTWWGTDTFHESLSIGLKALRRQTLLNPFLNPGAWGSTQSIAGAFWVTGPVNCSSRKQTWKYKGALESGLHPIWDAYPLLLNSEKIPRTLYFSGQFFWKYEPEYCFQAWLQFLLGWSNLPPLQWVLDVQRHGGGLKNQHQMWGPSQSWPLGKTHQLEMAKPPRKFIRTSGTLSGIYQAFPALIQTLV